jgi:flagellar hook-length control protein FliK
MPGRGLTPDAGLSTPAGSAHAGPIATGGAPAGATPAAGSPAPQASAASPSGQLGAPSGYGVDLNQAIEAVHATIELATRQGLTSARIALAPAELGEIRIHLSQSASGLVARLTADTPAAAQALSEGRAELRQSLQSLGLTALHLDTGAFQSGTQGREGHAPQHTADLAANHRLNAAQDEEGEEPPIPDPTRTAGAQQSRGALVDVLA